MCHGTASEVSETTGLMFEFAGSVVRQLPRLSRGEMKRWCDNQAELKAALGKIFGRVVLTPAIWKQVYDAIGASTSEQALAELMATKNQPNRWIEPVLRVTLNQTLTGLRKLGEKYNFTVYTYADDLDVAVPHNDRDPIKTGAYAISFAPNVEADEEFKNFSAEQLKERGHQGTTLLERLLVEMAYIIATEGEHLDDKNFTLCAGSRYSDGVVPDVDWSCDGRKVRVF